MRDDSRAFLGAAVRIVVAAGVIAFAVWAFR